MKSFQSWELVCLFLCMSRKDYTQIIDHNSWLTAGSPVCTQIIYCCSITESFLTLQPIGLQQGSFLCLPLSPRVWIPVLCIDDPIWSSDPLLPPSLFTFCLSQPWDLFQWVDSMYQVAKEFELQQLSFQWIFRFDFFLTRFQNYLCLCRYDLTGGQLMKEKLKEKEILVWAAYD